MQQPQACPYSPGIPVRLGLQHWIALGCGCCRGCGWEGGLLSTQARPLFVGSLTTYPLTCYEASSASPPFSLPTDFNPFSLSLATSLTRVSSLFPPTLCAPVLSSSPPGVSSILPNVGPIPLAVAGLFFLPRPLRPSPWPWPCPPSNLFFLPL